MIVSIEMIVNLSIIYNIIQQIVEFYFYKMYYVIWAIISYYQWKNTLVDKNNLERREKGHSFTYSGSMVCIHESR